MEAKDRPGSAIGVQWAELVGWTVVAFALGFLFSTEVFLSKTPDGSVNLGSLADWIAATAGAIAAGSAVVIALLGRNELKRRATEGRELSEAVVGSGVIADMEMAVRLSRHFRSPDPQKHPSVRVMVDKALTFYVSTLPVDLAPAAGLPAHILRSLAISAGQTALLAVTAGEIRAQLEAGDEPDSYIVGSMMATMESFANQLRPAADYLHSRFSADTYPWADWVYPGEGAKYTAKILGLHQPNPNSEAD